MKGVLYEAVLSDHQRTKAIGPYSTAVISGKTVYLSGMIPADPATGKIVEGGIERRRRRCLKTSARSCMRWG